MPQLHVVGVLAATSRGEKGYSRSPYPTHYAVITSKMNH
jgi:hypothetical protein